MPQRQRLRLWQRLPSPCSSIRPRRPSWLHLAKECFQDPALRPLLGTLETRDPRQVRTLSVLSLFEQQQERLATGFDGRYFSRLRRFALGGPFSVQAQLKRMADLLIAALLLLLSAPFVLLAALLIWLEDRGPVLYSQQRSGWLGRPFTLYKLRTMSVQPADAPVRWTEPGDQRITAVGGHG